VVWNRTDPSCLHLYQGIRSLYSCAMFFSFQCNLLCGGGGGGGRVG